uniref:Uncharacterized protein n=1 Tax=Drosophila melanogaster TaxID=7227 RepID=M9NEB4_DROME|nr:uncharacterized protein Dmel_CG43255 [Drosophila melanogaster]AFH07299.1 uncharacterized protein Dmel_CG43255 [Drosophila melanogaster]|eukprot:NP_001245585.1 uncharacterized protein Dmel_CG43255 [Drosophila melanogaster]
MHYLHIFGLLVFLAAFGLSLERRDKEFYGISKEQLTTTKHKENSVEFVQHKISLKLPQRYNRFKRQSFTPFERRVIRLLRKLGLLKSDAEQLLDTLEKDKDLLRRLKKLLDEVDTEHETNDFLEDFFDLIFFKKI